MGLAKQQVPDEFGPYPLVFINLFGQPAPINPVEYAPAHTLTIVYSTRPDGSDRIVQSVLKAPPEHAPTNACPYGSWSGCIFH